MHMQSIPRTVLLDTKTGSNLLQWPVVEVETLRIRGKSFDDFTVERVLWFPSMSVARRHSWTSSRCFKWTSLLLSRAWWRPAWSTNAALAGTGLAGPVRAARVGWRGPARKDGVYFYVAKGMDGSIKSFFCQDDLRYYPTPAMRNSTLVEKLSRSVLFCFNFYQVIEGQWSS
jgi:hypothetical protein